LENVCAGEKWENSVQFFFCFSTELIFANDSRFISFFSFYEAQIYSTAYTAYIMAFETCGMNFKLHLHSSQQSKEKKRHLQNSKNSLFLII